MRMIDCLKWLWRASCGFRLSLLWNSLLGMFSVGVSLAFIGVCKHLIDLATGQATGPLSACIGAMLTCMALQLALSVAGSRLSVRVETSLRNALRYRLFSHLMESRWMGREAYHTGDMLNRLMGDAGTVTSTLCRNLPSIAVTLVQLAGAFAFLLLLDVRLAGILVFIMPVALLLSKSYVRRMRRLTREIRETDSRVQSHLQEHLQHRTLIRTLEHTPRAVKALSALLADLQRQVVKRSNFSIFSRTVVQVGFSAGYATAFLWGIFGLRDGSVTFGMMTAFLQLVSQVQRPMVELSRQVPAFIHTATSVERLEELHRLPAEQRGEPLRLSGTLGIRVENVDFAYPSGERKVLYGFTHDFVPGSLTAVVGETGSGKSTLLRLVLALLLPDRGRVVFYNRETEAEASPLTRCNLSYVPQGNTLVSGTIRDNLLMGKPDATEAELQSALHAAVADFVLDLPDGLDTPCGEQGAGLSEGQAQRVAIARGLLRPGGILLLDEPTSSLDAETEQQLLERLSRLVRHKTLILITHRETIARLCTHTVKMARNA